MPENHSFCTSVHNLHCTEGLKTDGSIHYRGLRSASLFLFLLCLLFTCLERTNGILFDFNLHSMLSDLAKACVCKKLVCWKSVLMKHIRNTCITFSPQKVVFHLSKLLHPTPVRMEFKPKLGATYSGANVFMFLFTED